VLGIPALDLPGFGLNTLRPLQTVSTLPKDFRGANACAEIRAHPSGKFLYVSNRGHDSIAAFALADDGKVLGIGQESTEKTPRSFDLDPSGKYLFAAGESSGKLASYFSRKGNGRNSVLDISDEELKLFPVEQVSWDDAQEFIIRLNKKERGRGYVYRLPSEAEWEYACRGGAASEEECSYHFYFAKPTNDLSSQLANFNGNFPFGKAAQGKYLGRPTRVGAYPANKLGLCDIHGNVWQWCADAFPGDSRRVSRGGNWVGHGSDCLAANRSRVTPTARRSDLGFRLARVPVR
jgi:formylglycine-generating enzyme required for sulfatase activity